MQQRTAIGVSVRRHTPTTRSTMNARGALVAVALAVAVVAGTAVPGVAISAVAAEADDAVVMFGPNDDIQAARDAAGKGAITRPPPGTYRQAVMVERDDVTLQGSGPATVLTWPAALPAPAACTSQVVVCLTGNRDRITNL